MLCFLMVYFLQNAEKIPIIFQSKYFYIWQPQHNVFTLKVKIPFDGVTFPAPPPCPTMGDRGKTALQGE
jgi:hypothetical protein